MVVTLIFLAFDCDYYITCVVLCVCVCSPICSGGGVVDKYLPAKLIMLPCDFIWIAHAQRLDALCLFFVIIKVDLAIVRTL